MEKKITINCRCGTQFESPVNSILIHTCPNCNDGYEMKDLQYVLDPQNKEQPITYKPKQY